MNRKVLSKLLCITAAAILMGSLFIGCGAGKTADKSGGAEGGKQGDQPVTGYPITDKPITFKYWTPIDVVATQYIRSYAENEAYMEMKKRTGIDVEFIHPANGQENEQFNLMIASNDLPDMINGGSRYKGGILKGIEDKVFFDISPYLAKYAPDYLKLVNSEDEIRRGVKYDNGSIPAFQQIKPVLDPVARRYMVRNDWVKELGLKVPKTMDDWEKYLQGVKDKKNIKDPLIIQADGQEDVFMGAFGVRPGFYLKDGKEVAYGLIQPAYKDYLTLMNKWYSFGYLSKEFPAIKANQLTGMLVGGRAGAIGQVVGGAFVAAKEAKVEIMSTPYPRLKDGDKLHWTAGEWKVQGQETVVTEACKYKFEAIRWLNYPYTSEGAMLFNYGVEGKSFTMVNGKPTYTDHMLKDEKVPLAGAVVVYRVHFAPKLMFPGLECNPGLVADIDTANFRRLWSDDKDVDGTYELPPLKMTLEESSETAQVMTDIKSYASEMTLKFIVGSEPISKYDEYVKHIKDMGIDKAVANNAKAYARYVKN